MSHLSLRPLARHCVRRGPAGRLRRYPAERRQQVVTQAERVVSVIQGRVRAAGEPGRRSRGSRWATPTSRKPPWSRRPRSSSTGRGWARPRSSSGTTPSQVRVYSVEVTADAPGLERYLTLAHAGRGHPGLRQRQLGHALGHGEGSQHGGPGDRDRPGHRRDRSSTTWWRRRRSRCCSGSGSRRSTGPRSRIGPPGSRVLNPHEHQQRRQLVGLHRSNGRRRPPSASCSTAVTPRSRP